MSAHALCGGGQSRGLGGWRDCCHLSILWRCRIKLFTPTFSAALVDSNISTLSWIECGDSKPEYRRRAQQCLEMARTFGDHGGRVTLADMAQAWLRVADNCKDAKKVRPAMQQQQQIQPKDDSKKD